MMFASDCPCRTNTKSFGIAMRLSSTPRRADLRQSPRETELVAKRRANYLVGSAQTYAAQVIADHASPTRHVDNHGGDVVGPAGAVRRGDEGGARIAGIAVRTEDPCQPLFA